VEDPVPVDAEAKSNAMNGLVGILIVRADSRPRLLVEDDTRHAHPTPSAVDAETRKQTGASVTPAEPCGTSRESIARGKPGNRARPACALKAQAARKRHRLRAARNSRTIPKHYSKTVALSNRKTHFFLLFQCFTRLLSA
jgi:hypothetical protein